MTAPTNLGTGPSDRGQPVPHISVLGNFQVEAGPARIMLPGTAQRLLAFLALAGTVVTRARVAGTLWPDASESRAYGNLRAALSRLGAGGRRVVRADALELELAESVLVDVRVARGLALRLLDPAPPAHADLGAAAVMTLSRELLPGWYDDWVLVEAEEWRQLRLHALEALAAHLARAGRFGEAAIAAGASVRAEPLRESAHASLIHVHLAEGNHAEAHRQFERFRRLLGAELGLEPSARVRDLLHLCPRAELRQ